MSTAASACALSSSVSSLAPITTLALRAQLYRPSPNNRSCRHLVCLVLDAAFAGWDLASPWTL